MTGTGTQKPIGISFPKGTMVEESTSSVPVPSMPHEQNLCRTLLGIRCKEIWIEGADRYRNPDEDVPQDFATHRVRYYQTLNQPAMARRLWRVSSAPWGTGWRACTLR